MLIARRSLKGPLRGPKARLTNPRPRLTRSFGVRDHLDAGTAATLTDFVRVESTLVRAGSAPRQRSATLIVLWTLGLIALLAALLALVGLAFAGSTARLADGVAIAGVDVGGLTPKEARALLQQRFDQVARVPVVFTAGGKSYPIKATTLGVEADWGSALESAAREGVGFGPVRGF